MSEKLNAKLVQKQKWAFKNKTNELLTSFTEIIEHQIKAHSDDQGIITH